MLHSKFIHPLILLLLAGILLEAPCVALITPKSTPLQHRTTIAVSHSFDHSKRKQTTQQRIKLFQLFQSIYSPNALKRRNISIPILNIKDPNVIVPLPAAHLPNELTSLNIYGIQLEAAIHKMMIQEIMSKFDSKNIMSSSSSSSSSLEGRGSKEPIYGHLIQKSLRNTDHSTEPSLVGAIGCAAEIIIASSSKDLKVNVMDDDSIPLTDMNEGDDGNIDSSLPMTVLCKGSFRFIVKEVTQSFPFPIAIVDELIDDEPDMSGTSSGISSSNSSSSRNKTVPMYNDFNDEYEENDDEDDVDDGEDMYQTIDPSDLIPRTMSAMKTIVDQKINTQPKSISPLEQAILEEKGVSTAALNDRQQDQAEEMGAIFDVFASSMLDIAPTRLERMYSVAMLAAEFAGVGNDIREQILVTTNGVERLRIVLKEIEKMISMVSVAKLTEEITEQNDDSKDLKVGVPTLPPWSKSIRKGTKIEYFWNEVEGWCKGKVIEDPIMILDELILVILFDDGEIHKLPFQGDEKARWRPG